MRELRQRRRCMYIASIRLEKSPPADARSRWPVPRCGQAERLRAGEGEHRSRGLREDWAVAGRAHRDDGRVDEEQLPGHHYVHHYLEKTANPEGLGSRDKLPASSREFLRTVFPSFPQETQISCSAIDQQC